MWDARLMFMQVPGAFFRKEIPIVDGAQMRMAEDKQMCRSVGEAYVNKACWLVIMI